MPSKISGDNLGDNDSGETAEDRIRVKGDAIKELFGSIIVTDGQGTVVFKGPDAPKSIMASFIDGAPDTIEGVATGEDYLPPNADEEDEE
jgi:hypothetical protein